MQRIWTRPGPPLSRQRVGPDIFSSRSSAALDFPSSREAGGDRDLLARRGHLRKRFENDFALLDHLLEKRNLDDLRYWVLQQPSADRVYDARGADQGDRWLRAPSNSPRTNGSRTSRSCTARTPFDR